VFVAVSTSCFSEKTFEEACEQLTELEYDKVELSFDEAGCQLKPSEIAAEPERFFARYREVTRLTPVAFCVEHDVETSTFAGLSKLAKSMKVTQITIPSSPLGTPFNTEIDRLQEFLKIAGRGGIRLSVKTKTGHLTEDSHTAVSLCQAVRGLGLTLDPSHYICNPRQVGSYDQVFPYVYHVHLRDTMPNQLQVQTGLGEVDFSRLINQLRRQNYNRMLSVELIPSMMDDAQRPLEMRKLRMLLETLL
jgi:sugar phosphate isomerase/epimerase